jgi:hypothetical protein
VQLFFFARADYGEEATGKTQVLISTLERAKNALSELAERLGRGSVVWQYLENIITRQQLVDATVRRDLRKVRRLLEESLQPR